MSLLELENTLNFPDEEMAAIALPSGDKSAWAKASLPPPKRHVCLTWRDTEDIRCSSPRPERDSTAGKMLGEREAKTAGKFL